MEVPAPLAYFGALLRHEDLELRKARPSAPAEWTRTASELLEGERREVQRANLEVNKSIKQVHAIWDEVQTGEASGPAKDVGVEVQSAYRWASRAAEALGRSVGDAISRSQAVLEHLLSETADPAELRDDVDGQLSTLLQVVSTMDAESRRPKLRPTPENSDAEMLGRWLRMVRVSLGESVDGIALRVDKSAPYIRMIERGEKVPSPETLAAIFQSLGYRADVLGEQVPTVVVEDESDLVLVVELESAASKGALVRARLAEVLDGQELDDKLQNLDLGELLAAARDQIIHARPVGLSAGFGESPAATTLGMAEDPIDQWGSRPDLHDGRPALLGAGVTSGHLPGGKQGELELMKGILVRLASADAETLLRVTELLDRRAGGAPR